MHFLFKASLHHCSFFSWCIRPHTIYEACGSQNDLASEEMMINWIRKIPKWLLFYIFNNDSLSYVWFIWVWSSSFYANMHILRTTQILESVLCIEVSIYYIFWNHLFNSLINHTQRNSNLQRNVSHWVGISFVIFDTFFILFSFF